MQLGNLVATLEDELQSVISQIDVDGPLESLL
jgi:hypothetical protein